MIGLVVVAALAATPTPGLKVVPWPEVRADIAEAICVLVDKLPNGEEAFAFISGSRKACASGYAQTPLSRAVDKAIEDADPLLSSLGPGDMPFEFKKGVPAMENTSSMREAYLASEDFLRPILSRLPSALSAEGLACKDCPAFPARPTRRVSWREFQRYLTAHVWPDPVSTPRGPDGTPTGEPEYSFHICGGINGISEMKNPDRLLERAGFIAAIRTEEIREMASVHFQSILKEPDFLRLTEDAARTEYLRKHLAAALISDQSVKTAACATLARHAGDLALEVGGCGSSTVTEH